MRRNAVKLVVVLVPIVAGCYRRTTQFERYLFDAQWTAAAREFSSDSSLQSNERTLYQAALLLYGTPGRPAYDQAKSRQLFADLLTRFPGSPHAEDAASHLAMIDSSVRAKQQATKRERDLEANRQRASSQVLSSAQLQFNGNGSINCRSRSGGRTDRGRAIFQDVDARKLA